MIDMAVGVLDKTTLMLIPEHLNMSQDVDMSILKIKAGNLNYKSIAPGPFL